MVENHHVDPLLRYLRSVLSPEEMERVNEILLAQESPMIFKTVRQIGLEIEDYFTRHPGADFNTRQMDGHIREWSRTIRNAKPSVNTAAVKAFRRVLVEGERDW